MHQTLYSVILKSFTLFIHVQLHYVQTQKIVTDITVHLTGLTSFQMYNFIHDNSSQRENLQKYAIHICTEHFKLKPFLNKGNQ